MMVASDELNRRLRPFQCSLNDLRDFRLPPKNLRSRERHTNHGWESWGQNHPRYGSKLREKPVLTLGKPCRPRAFLVIVNDTIDTTAHGITPHELSTGAQQFGHCGNVLHARIEPEIVAVLIKDDWHSVMEPTM